MADGAHKTTCTIGPASFVRLKLCFLLSEFRTNKDADEMRGKLARLTSRLADSNAILGCWRDETHDRRTVQAMFEHRALRATGDAFDGPQAHVDRMARDN